MRFFNSQDASKVTGLEQRFQTEFSREILLCQHLRASILAGIFGVAILFLVLCLVYFKVIHGEPFFPMPLILFSLIMMVFQLGVRHYIYRAVCAQTDVSGWLFYVGASIEISVVSAMFLLFRNNFENVLLVLSTPPLLIYMVFISLSTLRLDFKMSVFIGFFAGAEYLIISKFVFQSQPDPHIADVQLVYYSWVRAFILFTCGIGCAFVARELRRRMLRSFVTTAERNREEAANEAKSVLMTNMSHEFRTPLNAILGYAQLMDGDTSLSLQQRQFVNHISTNGGHLLNLVNNLLNLSQVDSAFEDIEKPTKAVQMSDQVRALVVDDRGAYPVDLSETVLPAAIFNGLKKSAASYNMTQFSKYLAEAESLGEAERQLVAPLRRLHVQYDMKAVLEVLKEIPHD